MSLLLLQSQPGRSWTPGSSWRSGPVDGCLATSGGWKSLKAAAPADQGYCEEDQLALKLEQKLRAVAAEAT